MSTTNRIIRLAAGLTAALSLTALAPTSADASVYAGQGTRGYHAIVRPTCRYFDTWNQVDLSAPPPQIYAANLRAGAGNDFQPVRYRVFLVDVGTNQTIASSNYSGIVTAGDNSPAVFSGAPVTWRLSSSGPGQQGYRVDYRIEWLRADNYGLSAWVADRATSYTYFIGQVGPYAPIDRCFGVKYAGLR
jgi:hypothetical protein